ncbi:CoA transferase [Rhodococcus qingshengii]|uniref:CoA transferase n=1 Tax=Rhodococcus qingshengii TaxID=334542 RepID=A0AAW6LY76_RHOSG|nr:CoA transferase [Rhodococcus qingshengii]MDE8649905.1 CoA transferase [Rhodococcus qingshengii]
MLSDVVVLDLSRALAGPHAAMMLADLGARVIKIESPAGDDTRKWGPPFVGPVDDRQSTYFLSCNRNKESLVLDLKSPDGALVLERLVKQADVLLENFRTGVLDRLGFSVDRLHELNPRLIVCSITGFGHDGPEGDRPGYDQIAQGEAGLMSITGEADGKPTKVGVPIADLLAGIHATVGITTALYERSTTGKGSVVRTSLLAGLVGVHAFQGTKWTVGNETPTRIGNHHPSISPYGLFDVSDGTVQIAIGSEGQWTRLAEALNLPADDSRFVDNQARVRNRGQLTKMMEDTFSGRSMEDVMLQMTQIGIPAGRVRTIPQVYEWEQTLSQGLTVQVEHPLLGDITLPGPPIRFDHGPVSGARRAHTAPPLLGEHQAAILAWLDEAEWQQEVADPQSIRKRSDSSTEIGSKSDV